METGWTAATAGRGTLKASVKRSVNSDVSMETVLLPTSVNVSQDSVGKPAVRI